MITSTIVKLEKPVKPSEPLELKDKIRLDRYALKGNRNNLEVGDWVVVLTVEHPKFPVKEIGIVRGFIESDTLPIGIVKNEDEGFEMHDENVIFVGDIQMNLRMAVIEIISGSDYGQLFVQYMGKTDKLLEYTKEQIAHRVAEGVASVETDDEARKAAYKEFFDALVNDELVPAGRISTGAGTKEYKRSVGATDDELTLFNCYVIPNSHDSRHGLIDSLNIQVEIHSRGGGVGQNWSSARPRTASVEGVRGRSSGTVSWGAGKSYYTGLIEQGGSRRGATMGMLNDWHPDLIEFLTSKISTVPRRLPDGSFGSPLDYIRNKWLTKFPGSTIYAHGIDNANISVQLSDAFMEAVKLDLPWTLRFPNTKHPNYDTDWDGDLPTWINQYGDGEDAVINYYTYRARDIYDLMVETNWMSAEPGIVFIDTYRNLSNSYYYKRGRIDATNPCGEQGLPAWGVCNLSAINLPKFVDDYGNVDWDRLGLTVRRAVRFLDNVIDHTPYFFDENEQQQLGERRIGLGAMGLAEMLIKLGLRYGSDEGNEFIDMLYRFMAIEGYHTSSNIAAEKGSFPWFEADKFLESNHVKRMVAADPNLEPKIRSYGMRNVTVFTMAPTGSTGTMMATSTGGEPYFLFSYYRNSRLGMAKVVEPVALRWFEKNDINPYDEDGNIRPDAMDMLPDYYVTSMDLTPEEHINAQAAMQYWVDSSISKTINAPQDHKLEDIAEMIMYAYEKGLKGFTYYRDKSRDEQVLSGGNTASSNDVLVEGLDELDTEQLDIVREFVRSSLVTKKRIAEAKAKGDGPTTEELAIMETGCVGGKCTND